MPVRSLMNVAEECHGCKKPLGTHRTITVDSWGNPIRFDDSCQCFNLWTERNLCGFLRRGTELVATSA